MAQRPSVRTRTRLQAEKGSRAIRRRELMKQVQDVALDLFDTHGYDGVTIEQIAEAAGVSPSTVYRQFGTKEQLVLYDELHPSMALVLEQRLAARESLAGAFARAATASLGELSGDQLATLRRRLGYVFSVPSVNRAMLADADETEQIVRETIALATGTPIDSLELHVRVSAVGSAYRVALRYWYEHSDGDSLKETIGRALALSGP